MRNGTLVSLLFQVLLTACSGEPQPGRDPAYPAGMTFDAVFEVNSTIMLEESDSVINVIPLVSHDAMGRFVVADAGENQVRIYDHSGRLVKAVGRKGHGPAEFSSLRAAIQLPGDRLAAFERTGRVQLLDSRTDEPVAAAQIPVTPFYAAATLDDTTILVVGRFPNGSRTGARPHLLGLLNAAELTVRSTFFPVPLGEEWATEARHFGHAAVAVRGDTIAALFSLSDSLYFFRGDGTLLDRHQIPSKRFRPLESHVPVGSGPEEMQNWLTTFSRFHRVYWAGTTVFVQFVDGISPERVYGMVAVDRAGDLLFEIGETPQLLGGDGASLLFVHPNAEVPNQWVRVNQRSRQEY
jgi:hypothetical protein